MAKNTLRDALSAPRPTLETLTSLSLTGTQIWDANLVATAQGHRATFSSLMLPKLFWRCLMPQKSLNFKAFFLHPRDRDKEWHLLLFWLWHPNSPQWGQNHHPPGGHQKMLEKTKCYAWWRGVPFSTATSTPASLDWGETTHCVFSSCGQHHLLNHQSHYPHPPPLHLHRHHHW